MSPIEAFIEAHLEDGSFTNGDLVRLAQQTQLSTYEVRQELESYGLKQVKASVP